MTDNPSPPESESPADAQPSSGDIPVAHVEPRISLLQRIFGSSRMWWATAACAIVAIILLISAFRTGGTHIAISFQDGFGIKPGDTLRFRGIDVGEVTEVDVKSDLEGVNVWVRLEPNAADLAREGSRFWIERPQVGLTRITGLDTVVGAKYIGVIPGDPDANPRYRFEGIDSPPVIRDGYGSLITIKFDDGHGIATGDVVRHLGIVIGEVTAVEIDDSLESVTVHVRLAESAAQVAKAGSQFWIERPELGLSEIRGLETLVQGPYIDFLPGPKDGPVVSTFQGIERAPPATREPNGLEVILYSNQRRSLKTGLPVNYRGMKVGHVVSAGLASDASVVQARIYIEPEYKSLVRVNSQFWSNIGLDADFSVRGIKLKTESLQSLAVGSIGFATPDQPGQQARTGERFECAAAVDEEWLEWNPQIAVGARMMPVGTARPQLVRSSLRWKRKQLAVRTVGEHRQGWVLPLSDSSLTPGTLMGLTRNLLPDEGAIEDSAVIEMSGEEFAFDATQLKKQSGLSTYHLGAASSNVAFTYWPLSKTRRPTDAEDCLVIGDNQFHDLPIAANQIEEANVDHWLISSSLAFDNALDGACVVGRSDGFVIGFIDLEKGQAVVRFVSGPEPETSN